jgi:acetyltransferase
MPKRARRLAHNMRRMRFKPPDYPIKWQHVATTRDNVSYRIRPICAEGAPRERSFIVGLSAESRFTRMMFTMRAPSSDLVEQFVQVGYHRSMAFVAVLGQGDDERIIGVARYASNGGAGCEFAVAIADAWQARGIAATLSRLLFDYARSEAIPTLYAEILATNHRMIQLVRWLGMSVHAVPADPTVLEACIDLLS